MRIAARFLRETVLVPVCRTEREASSHAQTSAGGASSSRPAPPAYSHAPSLLSRIVWATVFAIFLCPHPSEAAHKRWNTKTGAPSGHSATHGTRVDLAGLMALPDAPGVSKNDARYEAKGVPTAVTRHPEGS